MRDEPSDLTAKVSQIEATLRDLDRRPRRPWTEEHPALLWAILPVVVAGLGLLILNTVRKTGTAA